MGGVLLQAPAQRVHALLPGIERHVDWRRWLGLASIALLAVLFIELMVNQLGTDARGYWSAFDGGLYGEAWQQRGVPSFVYPPPAALLLWPFTLMPFPVFYGLLTAASMSALIYLVGLRWAGFVAVLFLPALRDLVNGQIHILIAAALIAGWWPFLLLTKIGPGVGLLGPLLRRVWRVVWISLGISVVLCVGSVVILGLQAWIDWGNLVRNGLAMTDKTGSVPIPLLYRLPVALAVGVLAVRWRWLMPVGVLLALPAIWLGSPSILLAIPRLLATGDPHESLSAGEIRSTRVLARSIE
jgi:hypothetical protein